MLWFLASPYTNYVAGHEAAYQRAKIVTNKLLTRGIAVYSPIVYSHQFVAYGLPITAKDWEFLNDEMTRVCDGCIVYQLEGWKTSAGVKREVDYFTEQNKPIEPLPEDIISILNFLDILKKKYP
jgi:hypothetical protein